MSLGTPGYHPRILDRELVLRLESVGAVVIEGAKGTGKTESARQVANSAAFLDTDSQVRHLLEIEPALVLEGARPRLIDEWQLAPELWNHVRRAVDDSKVPGQFILTGSATPVDDRTRHSGAGRFSRLRLRPLTFVETGDSAGAVSLAALFAGEPCQATVSDVPLTAVVQRVVKGGFPATLTLGLAAAKQFNSDYLDQISRVDIADDGRLDHDPVKVRSLLHSLARNIATEARVSTLLADLFEERTELARTSVYRYLDTLTRIFLLEEQPAWSTRLRSSATLRKAPKRHLVDVALAAAALNADEHRLLRDPHTLGLMFESSVYQNLLVYAAGIGAAPYHYRDSYGREIDIVLQAPNGDWLGVEVKLGAGQVDVAAANLLAIAEDIDAQRPTGLLVITATGYAYTRPDGVSVVPITLIGP